jgi:hypothetical protein
MTHQHTIPPEDLPRDWAAQIWDEYVTAGGSSVPESRTWEAYREDIAWIWYRFVKPLAAKVATLEAAIGAPQPADDTLKDGDTIQISKVE